MLGTTKQIIEDQNKIREWLSTINETDSMAIKETLEAMRLNPDYRKWIVDYAKQC